MAHIPRGSECKNTLFPPLQKSVEQEQAPPEPWIKQILSCNFVQERIIPLSNTGSEGYKK